MHSIGKNKEAADMLSRSCQRGAFPAALAVHGFVLAKLGKHNEAIEKFKEATRMNPTHPHSYVYWADSLNETGHKAEAIKMLEKRWSLIPDTDKTLKKNATRLIHRILND